MATAVLGRYELLRPIAAGGMATVYLGRVLGEGGFERLVAVKLLHPHIAAQPEFVTMFLDEARLAARIRHPNVVPTLAIERGSEGLFLVMEYVEGHALHTVLRTLAHTRTALPLPVSLRIILDTLEGMHAAHELKDENGEALHIVHRDISPQNVLLGIDGVVRITDFGVAQARSRLSNSNESSIKGKVGYLSPEQVVSGQVDRRSDIFAAGVVLWELLTRRRLFRGETDGQTLARIMGGARQNPSDRDPTIPQVISDVVMKALASNPDARFATAMEFVDALEHAAERAGIAIAKPRDVTAVISALNVPAPSTDGVRMPVGEPVSVGTGSKVLNAVVASSHREPVVKPRRRIAVFALSSAVLVVAAIITVVIAMRPRNTDVAASTPAPQPAPTVTETAKPVEKEKVAEPAESKPVEEAPPIAKTAEKPGRPEKLQERPRSRQRGAGYKPEGL
jgi:eukaryotic-like serine/threonine-protein kinase